MSHEKLCPVYRGFIAISGRVGGWPRSPGAIPTAIRVPPSRGPHRQVFVHRVGSPALSLSKACPERSRRGSLAFGDRGGNETDFSCFLDGGFPISGVPTDRRVPSGWSVGWISGFPDLGDHEPHASEERAAGPTAGGCPHAAVATFFGLPPLRPFARDARAFAALRALPPSSPRRAAIHRFDPKNPSNSEGMYKSASSAGK